MSKTCLSIDASHDTPVLCKGYDFKNIVGHIPTNTRMGHRQLAKKTALIIEFGKVNIFKCVYVMTSAKNASSPIRCT